MKVTKSCLFCNVAESGSVVVRVPIADTDNYVITKSGRDRYSRGTTQQETEKYAVVRKVSKLITFTVTRGSRSMKQMKQEESHKERHRE